VEGALDQLGDEVREVDLPDHLGRFLHADVDDRAGRRNLLLEQIPGRGTDLLTDLAPRGRDPPSARGVRRDGVRIARRPTLRHRLDDLPGVGDHLLAL